MTSPARITKVAKLLVRLLPAVELLTAVQAEDSFGDHVYEMLGRLFLDFSQSYSTVHVRTGP